jgi:hypothetical protein
LVKAGFPESSLPEDAINFEAIIGTRVRFVQVIDEAAKKKGLKQKAKNGKEYDRTRPSVEQHHVARRGGRGRCLVAALCVGASGAAAHQCLRQHRR